MVAMDLDNVHDVVSNIFKFAATIFVELFNHKGKEKNNGNTRMEHLDRVVAWVLKEFKVGIVDLHAMKDGVQNCSYKMSKSCEQKDNNLRYVRVIVILEPCQMFKIEHASNNHFKFWV